jgi:hypothetical protein
MEIASARDLYWLVAEEPPPDLASFLGREGLAAGQALMAPLQRHRRLADAVPLPEAEKWELWRLYGFSRLNDCLLLPFQPGEPCPEEVARTTELTHVQITGDGREVRVPEAPPPPEITIETYLRFWEGLGFEPFGDDVPYSPYHHEIVVVDDSAPPGSPITVDRVVWPGLTFGELLFSRAGVRVRCPPGVLDKPIAERSTLYFAFRRRLRRTTDLSVGWGHNSQWRTAFHRSYEEGGRFHFNVEGTIDLGVEELAVDESHPAADLSLPERRELLVHRCFVTSRLPDKNRWPYHDTLTVPKDQPAWPT